MNRMHGFDLAGCGFCCVGLGVARAAIDEFVELAQVKVPRSSSELLRDRAIMQAKIGQAEALLRSGRALLFDVVEDMWETVLAARPITERQRADLRLAMTHAAQSAGTATHMVCAAAGTTSIFTKSPLERTRAMPRSSPATISCNSSTTRRSGVRCSVSNRTARCSRGQGRGRCQ